jgi:hypothetical protein
LAFFADAAKFAKPTTDLWRFNELDHLVLAGLTLESMHRRAGFVPLYSREPHRCAALDARDLFKMRNGLKLAHGNTLLPFQAERERISISPTRYAYRRKEREIYVSKRI